MKFSPVVVLRRVSQGGGWWMVDGRMDGWWRWMVDGGGGCPLGGLDGRLMRRWVDGSLSLDEAR